MTDEDRAMLNGVDVAIKRRLAAIAEEHANVRRLNIMAPVANMEIPPPIINVPMEAPIVNVHVDMEPVTNAMAAMVTMANAMQEALTANAEMLSQLIRQLAEWKPGDTRNIVKVSPTPVTVEAPIVHNLAPERAPRTFTIKHSDGTESTVTEA